MDANLWISMIVEEVVRRLQSLPKAALVVFTGATAGFEEGLREIARLKDEGWQIKVLFSRGAQRTLKAESVRKALNLDDIIFEDEISGWDTCCSYVDVIILPTLTQNTAVKVALGIADTPITRMLSQGLLRGTPMVAAVNGCDPACLEKYGYSKKKVNTLYLEKLAAYMEMLKSYGIQLTEASSLYDKVLGNGSTGGKKETHVSEGIPHDASNKKVISRADVVNASSGSKTLLISKNAIVTAYAKDAAKDLSVKIVLQ
ncbi:Flavoprotein [Geosporobacter subterraneus DSM 17957]|uniref:Flavoprotein n=1 Tax=Geosporobacter subterraneus DSM 17957 TaxID=1121919 RepID=A0A1M6LPG7_9FIRM|nr:flavoprotein [Geosporobacter subterraneus]SHJ73105.1 Flavoprotein [Geosporobacter subterraneus DSM 17957]